MIYQPKKKNLKNYKQLTCHLKSENNKNIKCKVRLKEYSGEIWQQKTTTVLTKEYQLLGSPLSEEYFELIPNSYQENSYLNFENINQIQFLFWSDRSIDTCSIYIDDLILNGNEAYYFEPTIQSIDIKTTNQATHLPGEIGNITLLSQDNASPRASAS